MLFLGNSVLKITYLFNTRRVKMNGKCPKCEKIISSLNLSEVESNIFIGTKWRTVTYNCPHCSTVLGCQIDPIAIKTDIVNEILNKLKKI